MARKMPPGPYSPGENVPPGIDLFLLQETAEAFHRIRKDGVRYAHGMIAVPRGARGGHIQGKQLDSVGILP
ncbi:MAG TPA: hypothetical protein PKE04_07495, partial [Clostridia bacterium]|nr:hypothetical protein [Clostridia bacterium]